MFTSSIHRVGRLIFLKMLMTVILNEKYKHVLNTDNRKKRIYYDMYFLPKNKELTGFFYSLVFYFCNDYNLLSLFF